MMINMNHLYIVYHFACCLSMISRAQHMFSASAGGGLMLHCVSPVGTVLGLLGQYLAVQADLADLSVACLFSFGPRRTRTYECRGVARGCHA